MGSCASTAGDSLLNVATGEVDASAWQLSDLALKETVGTGCFARVQLCRHKTSGQFFAIKCCKKQEILQVDKTQYALTEAEFLGKLSHPFIVNMLQTFQDDTRLYLLMDFLSGGELETHLRKAVKFPEHVSKFYSAELVCALEFLHSFDIVHRDLNVENVLLDREGHAKLVDFGCAKRISDRSFTLLGTPEYVAPEVIQSHGHGKSADWWALGILMYEMAMGYPPVHEESPFLVYKKILKGNFQFPRKLRPSHKGIISGLLTVDPLYRLGSHFGAHDIKRHPFFTGVDWHRVLARGYPPPIAVKLSFPGDTRYFERYPEHSVASKPLTAEQQSMFANFGSCVDWAPLVTVTQPTPQCPPHSAGNWM